MEVLIDGVLKARLPNDKQKLLKSDWRDRYCVLEKDGDGFAISIYKTKTATPSVKDRGLFREAIVLSPSTVMTVEDQVNKAQPFFQYLFQLNDGNQYRFSTLDLTQRDAWVSMIKDCIAILKRGTTVQDEHTIARSPSNETKSSLESPRVQHNDPSGKL